MNQCSANKIQIVILLQTAENKLEELLLLKTNEKRGGFWQNITGKMEKGETPIEAAHRELFEETALHNRKLHDINYQFHFAKGEKSFTEQVFLCLLNKKENIQIDPHEHNDLKWLKVDQIKDSDYGFSSSFEAFQRALFYAQEKLS